MPELNNLRLSLEEVKRNNPQWSDEMCNDYIGIREDLEAINQITDDIFNALRGNSISNDPSLSGLLSLLNSSRKEEKKYAQLLNAKKEEKILFFQNKIKRFPYYASLHKSTSSNILNNATPEKITGFTVTKFGLISDTETITINETGLFEISFTGNSDPLNTDFLLAVYINSAPSIASQLQVADSSFCFTYPVELKKNDTVELFLVQNTGASATINLSNLFFSVRLIWDR